MPPWMKKSGGFHALRGGDAPILVAIFFANAQKIVVPSLSFSVPRRGSKGPPWPAPEENKRQFVARWLYWLSTLSRFQTLNDGPNRRNARDSWNRRAKRPQWKVSESLQEPWREPESWKVNTSWRHPKQVARVSVVTSVFAFWRGVRGATLSCYNTGTW